MFKIAKLLRENVQGNLCTGHLMTNVKDVVGKMNGMKFKIFFKPSKTVRKNRIATVFFTLIYNTSVITFF